jgi:hypothetical protein
MGERNNGILQCAGHSRHDIQLWTFADVFLEFEGLVVGDIGKDILPTGQPYESVSQA